MELNVMYALLNNAAILLVLSVIYDAFYILPSKYQRMQQVYSGLMISLICIAIMTINFPLQPGVFYDTRSILISVTALMFGLIPTAITACTAIVMRLIVGGDGALPGILIILSSAFIGLAWRYFTSRKLIKQRWLNVLFMGIIVHVVVLCCLLPLPYPDNIKSIKTVAVPVMTAFPLVSVMLSMLLMRKQEHKNVQIQLKQSEERFRILFDRAPLSYQSLDYNGNFLEVNQQWLDTLGYSKEEVIGKCFGDFLSPEYKEFFLLNFSEFKNSGRAHCELKVLHKDGTPIFFSVEGKINYGPNGEFKQTHCILQDITKQKATEKELLTSEEKYRRLYVTMAQGVLYQDFEGVILSANPAAEKILGVPLQQMLNKTSMSPDWNVIREDGSKISAEEHPSMIALRTGKPFGPVVMGVYNPQSGDYVWISINAIPLFRPGENKPYQVYTTFRDITAERKANQDFQLLFREMVDGFSLHEMIFDDHGNPKDYRFLAVNPAFEHMTGLKSSDIIGKTVLEVMPETEQYWIDTYGKVVKTGEPIKFKDYAVSSGKHFEVSAYRPSPNQFACTFSDITKRVHAEESTKKVLSRLQSLLENSPSPVIIVDGTGRIVEISSFAKRFFGLSKNDTLKEQQTDMAPAVIAQRIKTIMSNPSDEANYTEYLDVFVHNGTERYFESRMFQIQTPELSEKLFGYLSIEVTQRIMAEQALKESEKKYSSYIEKSPYAVFVINEDGRFQEVNNSASVITGYSKKQLLKTSLLDLTATESHESAIHNWVNLKNNGTANAELQYVHKNGSVRWWDLNAVTLTDDKYLLFSIDTTEKKKAEAELLFLSYHDVLTGIYNRRFFEMELSRLDKAEYLPLSIIMADINGVKLVNDAFGHAMGDRLIKECVKIIRGCCPSTGVFARISGDEFGIIMPNSDENAAMEVLKKIQAALTKFDKNSSNKNLRHSISLGFSTKTSESEDIDQLIIVAEKYMYQRKLLEHNSSHSAIVSSIKATMFEKSQETEEHADRLATLSRAIAKELNLSQFEQDRMELLATLHDIGKIGINNDILTKQGKLTEEEWAEMKRHPEIGYRIAMASSEFMPVAEGILCHHERWDGKGYPRSLSRDSIPLLSRILAVVDSYDAMTQDRSYRKAMTHEEAIKEIERNSGTQFDPHIAKLFIDILRKKNI